MAPEPIYTFLVNNIDYQTIYSQPLPGSIENIIGNLNDQLNYVPYVNKPLKNGDVFTLYGKRAQTVYDMFINKSPKVLELVARTSSIPTLITKNFEFDKSTLPGTSAFSNKYSTVILNCSDQEASFYLKSFDSNNNSVNINVFYNDNLIESSPTNYFLLSINSNISINLNLESDNKFYYTYSELTF